MTRRTSTLRQVADRRSASPGRAELVLLAALLAVGIGLRFAFPGRMAVEHFDEGVYASNLWFGEDAAYRYPYRHLYAPPLLPWLTEWSMILFGTGHMASMLVSLLAGSATILVLWWTARCWFGPQAGAAAAVLGSLSDVHLLYSRAVLTDVLLCLWLLLAVQLACRALRIQHVRSLTVNAVVIASILAVAAGHGFELAQNEALRRLSAPWLLAAATWIFCATVAALFVVRRRLPAALPAGIVTGLAWWTKYNGWLPLAVAGAGIAVWAILERPKRSALRSAVVGWAWMAAAAFVVWSPVLADLQLRGGYAAVAANHSRYLVGLEGWPESLTRQLANLRYFDGWLTVSGFFLGGLAAALVRTARSPALLRSADLSPHCPENSRAALSERPPRGKSRVVQRIGIVAAPAFLVTALASVLGSGIILGVLGCFGVVAALRCGLREEAGNSTIHRRLEACLLAAWFFGLLAATPFYRPYPRLILPWLMAAWLGCGALLTSKGQHGRWFRLSTLDPRPLTLSALAACVLLATALMATAAGRLTARGVVGWQRRDGLEPIASQILGEASSASLESPAVYIYGEPALFFHSNAVRLRSGRRIFIAPVADIEFADTAPGDSPVFLAVGPHAQRSPLFNEQWQKHADRFQEVAAYRYEPSDLVALNHYSPGRLAVTRERPVETIRLYRTMNGERRVARPTGGRVAQRREAAHEFLTSGN